ncbi:hypothetical protein [Photorhabdus aballayi]
MIGVTCRLPVVNSLDVLWENLVAGRFLFSTRLFLPERIS